MADKLFNMPLDWDALLTDEKVIAMSDQSFRAYMHLLRAAWQSDTPASLPNNDNFLARVTGLGLETWHQVKPEVEPCFRAANGRWHQKRMRQTYDSVIARQKSYADRGKVGAIKRWSMDPPNGSAIAQPLLKQCLDDGSKSKSQRSKPPEPNPAEVAAAVGRKLLHTQLFEAICKASNVDPLQLTKSGAASIATALAEIRSAFPNVQPDEIPRRAEAYRKMFPGAALTAFALAKHWAACVPGATTPVRVVKAFPAE